MIVEDADRLTEQACNALLKAIEEPTAAHRVDALRAHRRGRPAHDPLALPPRHAWPPRAPRTSRRSWSASLGVDAELAAYAARASQGHIGRARALARDEETRDRRREVVALPPG